MAKKIGWYNRNKTGNTVRQESHRHSLASRGIKTALPKGAKGLRITATITPNFDMVKKEKMLEWKKNLIAVMDNPDYIEEQMKAINIELGRENPDTSYLRQKMNRMLQWADEIDLARRRASLRKNKKTDMVSGNPRYILKIGSRALSGFYSGDIPSVFAFRKRDWYSFDNKTQAKQFIQRIREEVKDPENVKRWGEKFTKKYQSIARNLKIEEAD